MEQPIEEWRDLSLDERAIVDVLLAQDFPGRDALAEQIRGAKVRMLDLPALRFQVNQGPKAAVRNHIPVEAMCSDVDGVTIHVLLFVSDGVVQEIEFYKDDGSPFAIPRAEALQDFFVPTSIMS